jgi:cytochrome P450
MGLPQEEANDFLEWEQDLLQPDPNNIEKARGAVLKIVDRVQAGFDARRQQPADDLLTVLVNAEIEGQPISDELRLGLGFNLFVGGLDTVLNQATWIFKFLAANPYERRRLKDDPDLIPGAIEEIMRLHSVLTTRRFVTKDIDFHGLTLKKGDAIEMPFSAGNRDSEAFEKPSHADITRSPNRHLGFGYGPHMCIGMHLARLELKLLVHEWLKQIPDFSIKENDELHFHPGIYGLNALPLIWR